MAVEGDPQELLDSIRKERGYTLPLHSVLAAEDPEVLAGYESMMRALYHSDRRLDARTKELLYIAVLVALGAAEEHLRAHMERARREGADPQDILEALELVIPAAGVARASVGLDVWRKVFRAGRPRG